MPNPMDFDTLLQALKDTEQMFPPAWLHRLSDLSAEEAQALAAVWPTLDPARRRALVEDMHYLLDASLQLSFKEVGLIALRDEDPYIRHKAIELLWFEEDPRILPLMLERLREDPEAQVRATAAAALGDDVYLGEIEELDEASYRAVVEALLEVLRDEHEVPSVRYRALEAVSFSSLTPEVTQWIERIYRDSLETGDEEGLRAALFAMGRSGAPRWVPYVTLYLHHRDPRIRAEAATAAGRLEMTRAISDLLHLLEDVHKDVRMAAAWALSELGGANEGVARALRKALRRAEDEEEAQIIAEALDNHEFQTFLVLGDLDLVDMALRAGEMPLLDVHLPDGVDLRRMNGHGEGEVSTSAKQEDDSSASNDEKAE